MATVELLVVALAIVALLAQAAHRLGIPYPVVLVLGGLALGAVPGLPTPHLRPDVVFLVFLPPLLYSAAYLASPRSLRDNASQISLLAVGLVLLTVPAVAVVAHAVGGLPWTAAFVLGAVLGPTDPLAATTIIHRLGAPERIATVLEGEALVNDGTALVAFRIAVGAAGATAFSLPHAAGSFLLVAAGGLAIGVAIGWISATSRRLLDTSEIEIVVSLATAYGAYVAAEQVGVSGVLAVVAAGLVVRRRALEISDAPTRLRAAAFWEATAFVLNAVLFLLVGLQLPDVVAGIVARPIGTLLLEAAAVFVALVALRFAWMFGVVRWIRVDDDEGRRRPMPARELAVLGWSGMRGAVSLAAAIAIPLAVDGRPFPDRDGVIFVTFCVVVATLVIEGLSLSRVLRSAGLAATGTKEEELAAERQLAHAALERLEDLAAAGEASESSVDALRAHYERQLARAQEQDGDGHPPPDEVAQLNEQLLGLQRERVQEMRRNREVSAAVGRELLHRLDLESSRAERQ